MSKNNGDAWSYCGLLFLAASLYLGYTGVSYETAIETPYADGFLGPSQTQSVQNFGLMLDKLLLLTGAIGTLLVAFICFATSSMLGKLHALGQPDPDRMSSRT